MNAPAATKTSFAALKRNQFINLTTYRKNGVRVTSPVGFALENGKIYGMSQTQAGKIKRMRINPKVAIAPSTMSGKPLGEELEARARLLGPEEYKLAETALKRKYGLQLAIFSLFMKKTEHVFWELSEV
jgi:PPOX class probable F420-dependent enzyme